jgi:hypothetical protein
MGLFNTQLTTVYRNPADRDHCIQYMTAIALIIGDLAAEHYEDEFVHVHPEIDELREKMVCVEKVWECKADWLVCTLTSLCRSNTPKITWILPREALLTPSKYDTYLFVCEIHYIPRRLSSKMELRLRTLKWSTQLDTEDAERTLSPS